MAKKVKVEGIEVQQWYLDKEPRTIFTDNARQKFY
jgi:hypothetical protein